MTTDLVTALARKWWPHDHPRPYTDSYVREQIVEAVRKALEEAEKIPREWADSKSCDPNTACEHKRTGQTIANRIAALRGGMDG